MSRLLAALAVALAGALAPSRTVSWPWDRAVFQVVNLTARITATPTFGVFVAAHGDVAFAPAAHRIYVRFTDAAGVTRGSTSVAVRTR